MIFNVIRDKYKKKNQKRYSREFFLDKKTEYMDKPPNFLDLRNHFQEKLKKKEAGNKVRVKNLSKGDEKNKINDLNSKEKTQIMKKKININAIEFVTYYFSCKIQI